MPESTAALLQLGYESRLAGPNAFWYNSPPLDGTACNKMVPIMGFNYERAIQEMVHDFMHRTESTMARVYASLGMSLFLHHRGVVHVPVLLTELALEIADDGDFVDVRQAAALVLARVH